jgi:hypothetical protein
MNMIARSLLMAALLAAGAAQALADAPPPSGRAPAPAGPPTRYLPDPFAGAAGRYYRVVWGIDDLDVHLAESGEIVRFSWRVLDPQKAAALNDKTVQPSLIDPEAGVSLVVPSLDNIGPMRQSQPPVAGKEYWMGFSNNGRPVKRGHRVTIEIGQFRAEGLVVD